MAATTRRKKATARKETPSRKKTTSTRKKSSGPKKTAARRKKTATRKKTAGRKYSRAASDKVGTELHEMKRGTLKSGGSGKKVTSRKQAIAIGLSEARQRGEMVPSRKSSGRKKSH